MNEQPELTTVFMQRVGSITIVLHDFLFLQGYQHGYDWFQQCRDRSYTDWDIYTFLTNINQVQQSSRWNAGFLMGWAAAIFETDPQEAGRRTPTLRVIKQPPQQQTVPGEQQVVQADHVPWMPFLRERRGVLLTAQERITAAIDMLSRNETIALQHYREVKRPLLTLKREISAIKTCFLCTAFPESLHTEVMMVELFLGRTSGFSRDVSVSLRIFLTASCSQSSDTQEPRATLIQDLHQVAGRLARLLDSLDELLTRGETQPHAHGTEEDSES